MRTYTRLPVAFERGEGAWLWDTQGKRYLDALSGIAVCGLGHAHPAVAAALREQLDRLCHTSNLYRIPLQEALAAELCRISSMDAAFFCNSGAEANESAIKIARLHAHQRGISNPVILVMDNSFHGRTLATLSATASRKARAGFEPLVGGFVRVPYNDLDALERVAEHTPNIVAVLVEPIQGEGGIRLPTQGYLTGLRDLCDARGWLLMLDEIQTGMGRTGKWFACQHESVLPDVLTVAKGLGNGFPIGACLARGAAADVFQPGTHGSTFGGSPLACRAALAVVETLESEGLCERASDLGAKLIGTLGEELSIPGVAEVRGKGLMIGIVLERPCSALVERALEAGLLINVTAEKVVRLLPPLTMSDDEADGIAELLIPLIREFLEEDA